MPEEQAPVEDTPQAPEEAAPDGTPADTQATDEPDWRDRYENLQPEYTRASQEAAQYRQIIDLARQGDPEALNALGLEAAETDTEDEPEYEDPDERISRVEQVLFERLQQEQKQQEEQQWIEEADKRITSQVDELQRKHGDLSEDDVDYLIDLAPLDGDGYPDLVAAFERDTARLESKRQSWVKSKRAPQVQSGASASSQPDLDDNEQRREYMARRMSESAL